MLNFKLKIASWGLLIVNAIWNLLFVRAGFIVSKEKENNNNLE